MKRKRAVSSTATSKAADKLKTFEEFDQVYLDYGSYEIDAAKAEEVSATAKKKKKKTIERKPDPAKKGIKYFDESHQQAVCDYQDAPEEKKKQEIYSNKLYPAFDSLVDNLINVYRFEVTHESKQDLKNECLSFLYQMVHKFDRTRGTKAFSYFNVSAKNWLTIKSKQNSKKVSQHVSIDEPDLLSSHELQVLENFKVILACDEVVSAQEFNDSVENVIKNLEYRALTLTELDCVRAIKYLMDNAQNIDLVNKRAITVYLKELTNLQPKQLSTVMSSIRKKYKEIVSDEQNRIQYKNE